MKTKQDRIVWAGLVGLLVGALGAGVGRAADTLTADVHAITTTPDAFETTPTIGQDVSGSFVVYASLAVSGSEILPGDIYYQHADASGAPIGAAIRVSTDADGSTDDEVPDVSGSRIVYTSTTPWEA